MYIFEPRYQEMLQYVLEHDRMMAVGTLMQGWDDESDEAVHPFSTAGLVRASVAQADGTSQLILQGVKRIEVLGWDQREPFPMARIQGVPTVDEFPPASMALADELQELAGRLLPDNEEGRKIRAVLRGLRAPDELADFVAANFLPATEDRLELLGMSSLNARLRFVRKALLSSLKGV